MRIRTIKPEFFNHEALYDAEKETGLPLRVAFPGLWCAADREGRFEWRPRRLKVQVLPYDEVDFSRVLDALNSRGFIRKYEVDGREYGVIPSFPDHQVINNRERASELPKPLHFSDIDTSTTRQPRVNHAGKAEGKGKEGNGNNEYDNVAAPCTLDQAIAAGRDQGITQQQAEQWWNSRHCDGWVKQKAGGMVVSITKQNWRNDLATVKSWRGQQQNGSKTSHREEKAAKEFPNQHLEIPIIIP